MSLSPIPGQGPGQGPGTAGSALAPGAVEEYEQGWVALHRFLREGGSFSGRERHVAFGNLGTDARDGRARFADVSAPSGLDLPDDGRAAARVDWDLDGDLDLVLTSRQAPRLQVLRNDERAGNGWVALRLVGATEPDAIGARVTIELDDGATRSSTLRAGEGYLAQSSKWVHQGLGRAQLGGVRVRWPGTGTEERFEGVAAGARWVLREGSGRAEAFDQPPALAAWPAVPAASGADDSDAETDSERVVLAARPPLPTLGVLDVNGQDALDVLAAAAGDRPVLYVVWASWCAPCLAELRALAAAAGDLERAGLTVVALGADEPDQRAAAAALLEGLDWPHTSLFAGPDDLETLDVLSQTAVDLRRRLPLPSSFLVDEHDRLAVIYRGPLDPERLAADVSRLRGDAGELRAAATPFPGRWHRPPPEVDLGVFQSALSARGLARQAREVGLAGMQTSVTSRGRILLEMGGVRAGQGQLDEAIEAFREAAALEPELFEAWSHLGAALHGQGQLAEAVRAYERALRLDPRHGETRHNLALARAGLGEPEEARRELELLRVYAPELVPELEALLRPVLEPSEDPPAQDPPAQDQGR